MKVAHDQFADGTIDWFAIPKNAVIRFRDRSPTFIDLKDSNDVVGVMLGSNEVDDEGFVAVETQSGGCEHGTFHALCRTITKNGSRR